MREIIRRRLLMFLPAVVCVFAVAIAGYMLVDGYPLRDAWYMALITITTVGYGEIRPLSSAGRIFNSFVILFGVSILFLGIGVLTTTIIELQLGDILTKRRIKRMIRDLNNHFIICGFGRVGRGAAAELKRAGVPFVIVDQSEARVEWAMRDGMLAVLADATRDETLRETGIDRAQGLIAALATDADNLFLTLSGRTLNPKLHISARVSEEEAEHKLRRAGADTVFAPYHFTGARLAQAMLRPHVTQFLDFTTQAVGLNVAIEQVRVSESSEFVSKSLRDMGHLRRDLGVSVLAVRKGLGELIVNPGADYVIAGGDYLIVMGEPERLRRLEQLLAEIS